MKKIFKLLSLALVATFALASCEDVPEPYPNPNPDSGQGGGNNDEEIAPEGDGTLANPFNVAAVVAYVQGLGSDVESTQAVYIKGKVKANSTTESTISQYGNMTFTMVDEGNDKTTFTAFQVYGPEKKKFTSVDQIKEGDEVIVCGKVVNYKGNTPETVGKGQAYVYAINGIGGGGEQPDQPAAEAKGDGTQANPYNVAGVNAYLDGAYDDTKEVYFTGIISKFKSGEEPGNSYGNSTFYISEDGQTGGEDFYCYRIFGLNGEKFTSADQLKVGDLVVVKSPVTVYTSSYGSTKETVQGKGQLVSVNGKEAYSNGQTSQGGGGNDQPDQPATGTEITCAQAAELALALEDKAESAETYTVTGYITETDGKISRDQQVFWMADTKDGGKVFEAFWANIPDPTQALPVGTKVKMTGKLMRYGSTPEMKNGQVVVLEMGEGGSTQPDNGGDTPSGDDSEYGTTVAYSLGANAYDDGVASINGVSGVKVLKIGTSKNPGDLTITVPASGKLTFYAVTWKGAGSATVSFLDANEEVATQSVKANDGAANNSPYTMTVSDSDKYEVSLPAGKQIKITSDKRIIFFGMK